MNSLNIRSKTQEQSLNPMDIRPKLNVERLFIWHSDLHIYVFYALSSCRVSKWYTSSFIYWKKFATKFIWNTLKYCVYDRVYDSLRWISVLLYSGFLQAIFRYRFRQDLMSVAMFWKWSNFVSPTAEGLR